MKGLGLSGAVLCQQALSRSRTLKIKKRFSHQRHEFICLLAVLLAACCLLLAACLLIYLLRSINQTNAEID